jgi:uncharacterized protein (TIGR00369 family)
MDAATLQGWLDESPFHAVLGRLTIVPDEGGVRIDADLAPTGSNETGGTTAHGGVTAALLDASLSFALIAATGQDWTTVDLRVDYLRPLAVGQATTTGRVVKAGARIGRAEGSVLDAEGRECARAVGTFVPLGPLA